MNLSSLLDQIRVDGVRLLSCWVHKVWIVRDYLREMEELGTSALSITTLIYIGALISVVGGVAAWWFLFKDVKPSSTGGANSDSWQTGANVGRALFGSKGKKSCRSCYEIIPLHAGKCPHCHSETKYNRSLQDHFDSRLK